MGTVVMYLTRAASYALLLILGLACQAFAPMPEEPPAGKRGIGRTWNPVFLRQQRQQVHNFFRASKRKSSDGFVKNTIFGDKKGKMLKVRWAGPWPLETKKMPCRPNTILGDYQ